MDNLAALNPQHAQEVVAANIQRIANLKRDLGDKGFNKYLKEREQWFKELSLKLKDAFESGEVTIKQIQTERAPAEIMNTYKDLVAVTSELIRLHNPRDMFDIKKVMQAELERIINYSAQMEEAPAPEGEVSASEAGTIEQENKEPETTEQNTTQQDNTEEYKQ